MKILLKLISAVCAVCLILSLAACKITSGDDDDFNTLISELDISSSSKDSESNKKPEPQVTPKTSESGMAGTVLGSIYINDFFGFSVKLDESWTYTSNADLQSMNNGTDIFKDTAAGDRYISENILTYTMLATRGRDSVNIAIENMMLTAGRIMSEEAYVSASKENVIEALKGIGYNISEFNITEMTINGKEHPAMEISGEMMGVTVHEKIAVVANGNYICTVTFAAADKGSLKTLEKSVA